jgi:hypothetical protein
MNGDASDPGVATPDLALRRRSRWLVRLAWLVGLLVAVVVVVRVATHPEELPRQDGVVTADTPAGQSVFVGVFSPGSGFDRELRVSGVKVFATAPGPVTITPRLCRNGSVGVTRDPGPFCAELTATEGATLRAGDQVVLEVVGDVPGVVTIDRVKVAYRDGFQWATQYAGQPAVVTIL